MDLFPKSIRLSGWWVCDDHHYSEGDGDFGQGGKAGEGGGEVAQCGSRGDQQCLAFHNNLQNKGTSLTEISIAVILTLISVLENRHRCGQD